ncbi:MAG: dTDP-4-dehydrorhamnose 3,5-epimerase [Dichotomicrobium sp.]
MSTERPEWLFEPQRLGEVIRVRPPRLGDDRGWFMETYNRKVFAENGITTDFVQDNASFSNFSGTIRGLHYQSPPFAQDKLVRVMQGAILDVAVDIRHGSATFGAHVAVELSAETGDQLLIPIGFAHGFVTRTPSTVVAYKVSNFYSQEHDHNIFWDDPVIGIDWGVSPSAAILSDKDLSAPLLSNAAPLL